jgi:hypothetical protein
MALGNEVELLIKVVPLAMGAAFTPSLFALQIITTSSPKWRSRSLAFALGSASAFLLACALLFFGFTQISHHSASQPDILGGVIWLVMAAVLLGVAIWLFRPHGELTTIVEEKLTARIDRANIWTFFGVAFVLSIKDITSFALIVPALHETAASNVNILFQLLTSLFVFALALIPVILPPLWRTLMPRNATRDLAVIYRFTMDNQFRIVGVVAALFCVYCLAMGILAF